MLCFPVDGRTVEDQRTVTVNAPAARIRRPRGRSSVAVNRFPLVAWTLICAIHAAAQAPALPPDIELDRHYREASLKLSAAEYHEAARSMAVVWELAEKNEKIELPASYWFIHARIHEALDELDRAHESATAYLHAEGRDGDDYDDAIRMLIRLEAALPEWRRQKDLMRDARATMYRQLDLAAEPVLREARASGGHGPEMVLVGKGFVPSWNADRREFSRNAARQIGPVFVAKYETTVQAFADFVEVTGHGTDAQELRDNVCSVVPDIHGFTRVDKAKGKSRTRRHWRRPGFTQMEQHPVVCVSIGDARAYAEWLSRETGSSYRLPSTAEWLLAARAGTYAASELASHRVLLEGRINPQALNSQYVGGCSGAEYQVLRGAYCGSPTTDFWRPAGEQTLSVNESSANTIGVFGLWGNVAELVNDCRQADESNGYPCMLMGGSFRLAKRTYLPSKPYVYRSYIDTTHYIPNSSADVGFRVVRDAD